MSDSPPLDEEDYRIAETYAEPMFYWGMRIVMSREEIQKIDDIIAEHNAKIDKKRAADYYEI